MLFFTLHTLQLRPYATIVRNTHSAMSTRYLNAAREGVVHGLCMWCVCAKSTRKCQGCAPSIHNTCLNPANRCPSTSSTDSVVSGPTLLSLALHCCRQIRIHHLATSVHLYQTLLKKISLRWYAVDVANVTNPTPARAVPVQRKHHSVHTAYLES